MGPTASVYSVHRLVWTALLAALTGAGAIIAIPLGPISPVPVTLQTMFVLLCGLILGSRGGALAILLYIIAGSIGLPVFAGGKAGLAVLAGPTGGFLLSFIFMALITGLARSDFFSANLRSFKAILTLCIIASLLNLLLGSLQLMAVLNISFGKALATGALPFIPGGLAKCLAATAIYKFMAERRLLPL